MKKKIQFISIAVIFVIILLFSTYKLMNSRTFQLFGGLTNKVETDQKAVALTFDDGPTDNVDDILAVLNQYEIKATFFLIGNEIEKRKEEAEKIVADGHQVGNHSYSHQRMIFKTPSFIKEEIEKTDRLIESIGYEGEIDFRPPNGKKLAVLPFYLHREGKETITWNIEPDHAVDKVEYVKRNIENGSIILLHPMYDESGEQLQLLESIIKLLIDEGYEFVTVNELQELDL
ncbi:polysaccharide deacetylase family protein [Rossellomorea vietnamensis]|uniref:Polysaccharide deacetylase family protein n=1 Tax=Rossellomorea vietnamensis TaxID=218284 RepID=A0A5D4NT47_9BACI|nr:polysaccharide deacetylase family protein [Rossellomorea vietnamensis]TYS16628.1 polysaccharide deacetylase family protein [Rossellomorea vietnamensis]